MADISKITSIVCQWSRNYHKRIQIEKHNRQLEQLSDLPTVEEIRKLDLSYHKKDAIKTLSTFTCTQSLPSRKEYCHVRDYLLTYVILDNASRSGCITNMTLGEYRKAEAQRIFLSCLCNGVYMKNKLPLSFV